MSLRSRLYLLRQHLCQVSDTNWAWPCRFILKTDDDAFVNVPAFVQQLQLLCESPDCRRERLYMGKQCRRGKVIISPGHKWDNGAYYNHTGASLQVRSDSHAAITLWHMIYP